jgi:hypothetical protein
MSGKSHHQTKKTKWLTQLLYELAFPSPSLSHTLEFIVTNTVLKLDPKGTQRKKSKKTGSWPIQGRSEQR